LPGPCPQIAPKTKIFWKELQDKLDISMSWKRVCSIEVFIEKISPDDIPRDEVPIMEVVGPIRPPRLSDVSTKSGDLQIFARK